MSAGSTEPRRPSRRWAWSRRLATILLVAFAAQTLIAWALTLWSPARETTMYFDDLRNDRPDRHVFRPPPDACFSFADRTGPLWYPPDRPAAADRFGRGPEAWLVTRSVGYRTIEAESVFLRGITHGFAFDRMDTRVERSAGWPCLSLRSVVRPLDDDRLRRWDLPWREIVARGLQTDDLPGWLRARSGRRLPLLPALGGTAVNTACLLVPTLLLTRPRR